MIIPAGLLIAAGLLFGLTPNLRSAASAASAQFESSGAYAAHVLDNRPDPAPSPQPIPPASYMGLASALVAIGIALIDLFNPAVRELSATLTRPLKFLHELHSGHIADYIVFLTFGMATFGLLCAYCFR